MSRALNTRTPEARAKTEAQKASLAEHVANGGAICRWGREAGVAQGWEFQLWAKIRRDLGEQAR